METDTWTPRELPIVAGHLALDFANTVDDPEGPERWDHITTIDGLMHWAQRVGLVTGGGARVPPSSDQQESGPSAGEEAGLLRSAHRLRDALNDVFGPLADADPVGEEPWNRLRPFIADAIGDAALLPEGSRRGAYRYGWTHLGDVRLVTHQVAASAGELLVSEDLSRLKRCARCPWLFLDHSKNRSRRWCDMDDCGKAEKIERYVAKRAARRKHSPGHPGSSS